MTYRGDIRLEDTIDVKFTTRRFSTGAPFALAGTPAVSAYVGNSVVQITAGITLTTDFDTVTGLNNVRVAATAANGYTAGTNVDLVITAGTVDSVSVVGEVIGSFSIEARSALRPTTAGRTLDVSAGGEAGLDWANIGSPTTAQNLSATNIDVDQVVASVSGAVGSVTGAVGSIAAGGIATTSFAAGAINAAAIAADAITDAKVAADVTIASVTGAVGSVTGAVGSVTGAVGSVTAAVTVGTNNDKTGYALSAAGVDDVLDEVVTGTTTLRQALRGFIAALLGKASGLATATAVYRNVADTKDVITATVDADGNRSAVTLDLT